VIVIIDTGCANLTSLKFTLERLNVAAVITDDANLITQAERVFLPGVGSAQYAMKGLEQRAIIETITNLTQPVLGICLGMQLLLESSEEGSTGCLGIIPGEVKAMDAQGRRLPHMGWNTLTKIEESPLLEGIQPGDYFYFVHSYAVSPSPFTLATCDYGSSFSAAIRKDNFFGVQFHPERSGEKGLQVLKNFVELEL